MGLISVPSIVVHLLLNAEISNATIPLGRVAGAALLTLGVASWLASYDEQSCAARGLVSAMVFYNIGTALILALAGIGSGFVGIALWPVVILHAVMAVWCVASLRRSSINVID